MSEKHHTKLHLVQIVLIAVLIAGVFFAGRETTIANSCPQPVINNFIDVNVPAPQIYFDKNMFRDDRNYSPNIIVNVTQKPSSSGSGSSNTYVTNNYITDSNNPVVYFPFALKVLDANGNTIVDDSNNFAEGTEAIDAMSELAAVEYTQYSWGVMIISIDGVAAGDHQFWALYDDGNFSNVGISDIEVNRPLNLEWRLESW